jgi:hypothetical protein
MRGAIWQARRLLGSQRQVPFGTVVFTATGYTLIVFLINNKEVGARVSKVDKSAFTDAEMKTSWAPIWRVPWTPTPSDDPTCLRWIRGDKATVLYDKEKHMLIFTSEEMANAIHPAPAQNRRSCGGSKIPARQ